MRQYDLVRYRKDSIRTLATGDWMFMLEHLTVTIHKISRMRYVPIYNRKTHSVSYRDIDGVKVIYSIIQKID